MTSSGCGLWIRFGVVRLQPTKLIFALDKICLRLVLGWTRKNWLKIEWS